MLTSATHQCVMIKEFQLVTMTILPTSILEVHILLDIRPSITVQGRHNYNNIISYQNISQDTYITCSFYSLVHMATLS